MEAFYDNHFHNYTVCELPDILNERIWNVYFDSTFDLIYLFKAKLKLPESDTKEEKKEESLNSKDDKIASPELFSMLESSDDGSIKRKSDKISQSLQTKNVKNFLKFY